MSQEPPPGVLDRILSALGMNSAYVVDVYRLYQYNPETISPRWRAYFEGLERGEISAHELPAGPVHADGNGPAADGPARPAVPATNGAPAPPAPAIPIPEDAKLEPMRGAAALIAKNMDASRVVPTATSYRDIPVKVLDENRRFINHFLSIQGRGKVSFTHVIAWALIRALEEYPGINDAYAEVEGKPHRVRRPHINLGMAIDIEKRDGSRNLLVPNLPAVETLDFADFLEAYNTMIGKARTGALDPAAFQGTSISITNPGTVGTGASVPRLMPGQGAIIAVGAIGYSAETRNMSPETLSELGISKRMTISCTYDHRVIQGAESGLFLAKFEALLQGEDNFYDNLFSHLGIPYTPVRGTPDSNGSGLGAFGLPEEMAREARALPLIRAYRVRGHLIANLDPLGDTPQYHPELDLEYYGLSLWDLDRRFITGGKREPNVAPLRDIISMLRAAYSGKIGVEYMNIQDPEQKAWIQGQVEPDEARAPFPRELRLRILEKLIEAESFEEFLHTRYLGHKRFSLEGGETLIPLLDQLLESAAAAGVEEVVIGMAHRGRLNVVTQTVGVDPAQIFSEFQGHRETDTTQGSGDVKYHLGAVGEHAAATGVVRISLAPNPSHLEAVDPVVEGITRAKQEEIGEDAARKRILPILIHGDAAFAGQGVVAETLNLSQLKGYRTGGTVHIIVNNQIGFTTPVESARSSPYPTDVAKMGQAPIFHVNGDDPEAAVRVTRWALDFRQTFEKDVVIDQFCYRRHGHNEGDEPSYTQPRLYAKIRNHPSVATLYADRLQREDALTQEALETMKQRIHDRLDEAFERAGSDETMSLQPAPLSDRSVRPGAAPVPRATAVDADTLRRITEVLVSVPDDVDLHPKLGKWLDARRKMIGTGEGLDWAFAEALAFGSLVLEGVPVRLSGQDSVRGTFSQRHLLWRDDDTDVSWMALQHVSPDQAQFNAVDSPLSEESVMGFEYGYSVGDPTSLVMWEAQFGDFVNEAQVVIDQFLVGSMAKWGQPSSLVLLLPHGYEGQGPDHSTARLERFLQLAAEDNIQVVYPTTPAQYFHMLRRQMCEGIRKPLVVMTPKSLLRLPRAASALGDLTDGAFQPVLRDPRADQLGPIRRIVFCSGKIFYDLDAAREKSERRDVALVRVEELYPFPASALAQVLETYPDAELRWAQEEPRNMGAWLFLSDRFRTQLRRELRYVGRPESASTATGYLETHKREQQSIVDEALGD